MTTDDAARAEAWADYAQTAHLRARPEPAGDRSALVQRFFLCRTRIVSLLTDMDECFQAAAPAPAEARSLETIARVLFFAAWNTMPDVVHPSFEHDQELWMEAARAAADALAPPPAVPDERLAELRDWFEESALNLQAATPDGNNPAKYKGPHPCDCAHFADDAIAQVRSLLAASAQPGAGSHLTSVATTSGSSPLGVAPAQPAEDAERIARIERYREALSKLNRRIRELEEALHDLEEASRLTGTPRLLAAQAHSRAILKGDSK